MGIEILLSLAIFGTFFGAVGTLSEEAEKREAVVIIEPEGSLELKGIIDADSTAKFMKGLKEVVKSAPKEGEEEIFIRIDSRGGSVLTGYHILELMDQAKVKGYRFKCFVDGDARSMAFILFANCDTRYAGEYSLLLFHPARVLIFRPVRADELRKIAGALDNLNQKVDSLLMDKLNMDKKTYEYHNKRETLWKTSALKETSPNFLEIGVLQ